MTNSRQKGAAFERKIAGMLYDELGIKFRRDLDQYRERDRGDLICDDPFPFLIECKHHNAPQFKAAWWSQAYKAALTTGQFPVVVYRLNRCDIRVRMQLRTAVECLSRRNWSAQDSQLIDMDFAGFCYVAREALSGGPHAPVSVEVRGPVS